MANEVRASVDLQISNGGVTKRKNLSFNDNQTTARAASYTQVVGTTAEAFATPADVTSPRYMVIENRDNAATVTIVATSGNTSLDVLTIQPLKANLISLDTAGGATKQIKASANNTVVDILVGSA